MTDRRPTSPFAAEITLLAEILSVQAYQPYRKGDGSTIRFLTKLLAGPVSIDSTRELGKNLLAKGRVYMFNHGLKLSIRRDTGCYILSMRQIKEER
jgi:hypothetical protein